MFELTINDKVYPFRFGIGFLREIDKTRVQKLEDGSTANVGLQYAVAALIDEDPLQVVEILDIANKLETANRVKKKDLEAYIEDENTDFEGLCKDILDFFAKNNVTKKKTLAVMELVEKEKAKKAAVQAE
jgi:hypothetical protein